MKKSRKKFDKRKKYERSKKRNFFFKKKPPFSQFFVLHIFNYFSVYHFHFHDFLKTFKLKSIWNSSSDESAEEKKEASLLLICKWGGELTSSGRQQAEELGKVFRCMYPGGQGNLKKDVKDRIMWHL